MAANNDLNLNTNFFLYYQDFFPQKRHDIICRFTLLSQPHCFPTFWQREEST